MEVSEEEDKMVVLREGILEHVSRLEGDVGICFKLQSRGEPELSQAEKRTIAGDLLAESLPRFLAKFHTVLLKEHAPYFRAMAQSSLSEDESYEINFYLEQLHQRLNSDRPQMTKKNRRLEALKKLVLESDYFTDTEMQKRNPLLYECLVGRFLTKDEKSEKLRYDYDASLSNFLLAKYDQDEMAKLLTHQRNEEDSVMEEEEEDDTEDEEDKHQPKEFALWGESGATARYNVPAPTQVSEGEKRLLFEEFRSYMYASFLDGQDKDFDYSTVDSNGDYDDLETLGRDEEEKYFDSESPQDQQEVELDVEDDPLDAYMSSLISQATQSELNSKMESLQT